MKEGSVFRNWLWWHAPGPSMSDTIAERKIIKLLITRAFKDKARSVAIANKNQ